MKIEGIVPKVIWQNLPQNVAWQRVAIIALPLIALVGFIFSQLWESSNSTEKPVPPPKVDTIQDLFNQVINKGNPSQPKINPGSDYVALKGRRTDLQPDEQCTLFYAELLSVCDETGLLIDKTPEKITQFGQTFLNPPVNGWSDEVKNQYRSILTENQSDRYSFHFNIERTKATVDVKGQTLTIENIRDNGDCLFESIIEGMTIQHDYTPDKLRQIASEKLFSAIHQEPKDEGLILQLAEDMRMHDEAHGDAPSEDLILQTIESLGFETLKSQFNTVSSLKACISKDAFIQEWRRLNPPKVDKKEPMILAEEYCKLLANPRVIYPGEATIKVLAEELRLPMVLVNGDSLRPFGEVVENRLPILIYKTPGNAHYNRLVVDQEQWQELFKALNRDI